MARVIWRMPEEMDVVNSHSHKVDIPHYNGDDVDEKVDGKVNE